MTQETKVATLAAGTVLAFDVGSSGVFVPLPGAITIGEVGEVSEAKEKQVLSDTIKKYGAGLADAGEATIGGQWYGLDAIQQSFQDACIARQAMDIQITFPNGVTAVYPFQPRGFTVDEPTGAEWLMFKAVGNKNDYTTWTKPTVE